MDRASIISLNIIQKLLDVWDNMCMVQAQIKVYILSRNAWSVLGLKRKKVMLGVVKLQSFSLFVKEIGLA